MTYSLGVDLGTTFTAAAIARNGRVEMVSLGNRAATIPSLVFLKEDETVLVGDAAERRGLGDPGRLAREFKRRFGDTTPILLAHTPFSAERLMANVLRQVVQVVTEREGAPPASVAVAHPANWGPFKTDLLRQAVELAGLASATLVSEPVAAAVHHATTERVDVGELVAVYDLGGGTFDAAVLRKLSDDSFETVGAPQGIERLGGIDVDEAVMAHVRTALGPAWSSLDHDDPAVRAAMARLHAECVAAKETLSTDSDTTIGVGLPGLQTEVRLTRTELEAMIRPILRETVAALRRTIDAAGVRADQISSVLLVGGASRMPLVAELVSSELGRPVRLDTHPKHAVALGAAQVAAQRATAPVASPASAPAMAPPAPPAAPAPPVPPTPPAPPAAVASGGGSAGPAPGPPARSGGRGIWLAAAAVVAAVVVGAAVFAMGGGGDDASGAGASIPDTTAAGTPVTEATTVPTTSQAPTTEPVVLDTPVQTTATTTPATTTTAPTCTSASGRCVSIDTVALEGDTYVATYSVIGFEPVIFEAGVKGTADDHHVHFFFDTTAAANAGSNGVPPGLWELWDRDRGRGTLRFDAFNLTNAADFGGTGATSLCAVVASATHAVESDSGNCVELPT